MKCATRLAVAVFLSLTAVAAAAQEKSQTNSAESDPGNAKAAATQMPEKPTIRGGMEVLTDTQGVDFKPYLSKVLATIRQNWYQLIPEDARPPLLKQGDVSLEFVILKDGKVAGMRVVKPTGDLSLDRAAWDAITASAPFAALPQEFHGPFLGLRFHFYYNPAKGSLPSTASDKK